MPRLQHLTLYNANDDMLQQLSLASELRTLSMVSSEDITALPTLPKFADSLTLLTKLRELRLRWGVTNSTLQALRVLTQLQSLELQCTITHFGELKSSHLVRLSCLTRVFVWRNLLGKVSLYYGCRLACIGFYEVEDFDIGTEGVRTIASVTTLQHLHLWVWDRC